MSIMAQGTNQRCNALQSIVGIFLHSAGTPETVIELLSRFGVSLTTTSINNAVSSLSSESTNTIVETGRTLLAAYAYDNVDIDLKHAMPTGDMLHDTLVHLTSGTLLELNHGVTREMLACSELLWKKSKHNPKALASDVPSMTDYIHLLDIHPEVDNHPSGLLRRERFNLWVFLRDLVMNGPLYFRKFKANLPQPESIDPIPLVKSRQVPARMMDINPPAPNDENTDPGTLLFRHHPHSAIPAPPSFADHAGANPSSHQFRFAPHAQYHSANFSTQQPGPSSSRP